MGDMGDMYRDMKDARRENRRQNGEDCIGCITHHPKRNPSILLPQQTCRVCGYRDPRPRKEKVSG